MKKARLEIEYNEYGIPILEKTGNPNLSFRLGNSNELYIEGNRDALILLAKACSGWQNVKWMMAFIFTLTNFMV